MPEDTPNPPDEDGAPRPPPRPEADSPVIVADAEAFTEVSETMAPAAAEGIAPDTEALTEPPPEEPVEDPEPGVPGSTEAFCA